MAKSNLAISWPSPPPPDRGALIDAGVPEHEAHVYSETVRRGGTIVTVRFPEAAEAAMKTTLEQGSPVDPVKRRADYEAEGWSGIDPDATDTFPQRMTSRDENPSTWRQVVTEGCQAGNPPSIMFSRAISPDGKV